MTNQFVLYNNGVYLVDNDFGDGYLFVINTETDEFDIIKAEDVVLY